MANHQEETLANNFEDQDPIIPNNAYNLKTDAYPDKDHIFSCLEGDKSSESETEEKGSKQKRNKKKLNKSEIEVAEIKYNTRALSKLASTYMLEQFDENLLIIFNQYRIRGYMEPRKGTMEDAGALINTFDQYGFRCERHDDWTRKQILDELDTFSGRDFTDYGCIVVVVMTHGTYGGAIMASDQEYSELDILSRLKARDKPTLVTKPIILLIQACRGKDNTEGQVVNEEPIPKDTYAKKDHYYLPVEADTLVFHSSYVGQPSFRPANGSWFIQTLCKKINEMSAHHDLESIMTEVKREVACDRESIVPKNKGKPAAENNNVAQPSNVGSKTLVMNQHFAEHHKQMPTVTSALTRKLYLIRKPGNMAITPHLLPSLVPVGKTPRDIVDSGLVSTIASTYSKEESDPCLCFLDHLDYMKNCLSHYVADHNSDSYAQFLLKSLDQQKNTNTELAKSRLETISKYLNQSMDSKYQKYIYFYGTDVDELGGKKFNRESEYAATKLEKIKGYVPGVVIGIGTYVAMRLVHNMINK